MIENTGGSLSADLEKKKFADELYDSGNNLISFHFLTSRINTGRQASGPEGPCITQSTDGGA